MPDKPRSFREVVAAQTPAERERLATAEAFKDVLVRNPFQQDVTVIEDRDGTGEWRVEYFDDDGACYVTVFSGPQAAHFGDCERRFHAMVSAHFI